MHPSGETTAPANMADQLQRRLRIAILEVLLAEPEAVHPQQEIPPGVRHERDFADRVRDGARALRARSGSPLGSPTTGRWGRHMRMSTVARTRPPSNLMGRR